MNEKIKNVVDYAKTHKKEILIATVSGAALIIGGVSFAKFYTKAKDNENMMKCIGVGASGLFEAKPTNFQIGLGTVTDVWTEADRTHMIITDITLHECGRFGQCIHESLDTDDFEYMDVIIALGKNYNVVE